MARLDRTLTALFAVGMGLFGSLPIANWIVGGHKADWYPLVVDGWISGAAIVLGFGVIAAISARRLPLLWREGMWSGAIGWWERRPRAAIGAIVAVALAFYVVTAHAVFSARPLLIDEIVQVFQARMYAGGNLWLPLPKHPEFFSVMHLVEDNGRLYGQYPAGGPALLALGTLIGAEWLIGPLTAAASVALFAAIANRIEPRPAVSLAAVLIFALAPFTLFMSGTYMNHVPVLATVLLAWLGLIRVTSTAEPRFRDGLILGLGLGLAATIRPLDAVTVALPAGAWVLFHAIRSRRLAGLLGSGLGLALPVGGLLLTNDLTTGSPLVFGYTVLWGKGHDPGFHATPWGYVHTPVRGLELMNLYFLRLQSYFLELPVPSLVPAIAALGLTDRVRGFDRYLLVTAVLVCGVYFSYWHDGFYLGPRFMYLLLPLLALWTVRLLPALRDRFGSGLGYRTAVYSAWIAVVLAVPTGVLFRAREYRNGMVTQRWAADADARAAGVRNALILVRESWGSQVIARLWAVGVSRAETELMYRRVDTCILDSALIRLEVEGVRGPAAYERLRPLLADSGHVRRSGTSPDPTEMVLAGRPYSKACNERVQENWTGFTVFPHFLLAARDGNVYARDLGARDSLLLAEMPDRPVYLLKPASVAVGAPPQFNRLRRDSLLAAWRSTR